MKKVFSQVENISVLVIVVLAFFPWGGLISQTGMDITLSVLKNITTLASIESYGITISVIFAAVALLLALMRKSNGLFATLSFTGVVVAFVFGMIETSGNYFSSMHGAYIAAVVVSLLMLLRSFGIIKLNF